TITLRLRDDLPRSGRHPLPGAMPVEAAQVEGGLGIDWDDGLAEGSVTVVPPGAIEKPPREIALPPDELPDGGPWGTHLPRRFSAWRGQPPQGTLTLRPRPVRLRTHSHNDVVVGPGGVAVSARLTVEAVSGAVGSVDLRLAAPLPGGAAPHLEVVSKKESR